MIKALLFSTLALTLSAHGPVTSWDFEQATPTLEQGWTAASDQMAAGSSYLMVRVEKDGSNKALHISGETIGVELGPAKDLIRPFVCAIHSLGDSPLFPADLSGAKTLSFRIKGHSDTAEIALFQEGKGNVPALQTVKVTPEWTSYRLPLASFGLDTSRVTALAIGRSTLGKVDVLVDDIQIQ